MDREQIETNFTYHPPRESQRQNHLMLRARAKELALLIDRLCPDSREKALALTQLEQCLMWANASLVRNP